MASIKCFYCKNVHASIAEVKSCAISTTAFAVKVETGKIVETVIPGTVGMTFSNGAAIMAAGGLKGIIEAKKAEKVATVPAHRTSAKYLALKAQVAPATPAYVDPETKYIAATSPAAPAVKKGQDLEIGMYQITAPNGTAIIYKVKWNKSNTYKYAEMLHITTSAKWDEKTSTWIDMPKGKFIYANSMMKTLTSEHKMTEEMAKAFHDATKAKYGVDYGFCCVCGKLLTVKKSIEDGIGPVCKGKI